MKLILLWELKEQSLKPSTMAGIYIHIPYCKKACHYCNFHFSTQLNNQEDFIKALLAEINLQKDYLANETIHSIYFGGGTPSLLASTAIEKIVTTLHEYFAVAPKAEITLEANPDDILQERLQEWKALGINRFSLGTQSFFEEDLQWMNRAHSATEAIQSIEWIHQAGFQNINIDLIYGYPLLSEEKWQQNLHTFSQLDIPHLSSYCLTVEPKTALQKMVATQKTAPMNDEQANHHFDMLMQFAEAHGYEHYEISNFAKNQQYAQHNTAYWQGKKYLGLGPSAHSYNRDSRQWNVANNALYIKKLLQENIIPFEKEILTEANRFNEYLMTSLRTQWGIDLQHLQHTFSAIDIKSFEKSLLPYLANKTLIQQGNKIILSKQGKMLADAIISDLMLTD